VRSGRLGHAAPEAPIRSARAPYVSVVPRVVDKGVTSFMKMLLIPKVAGTLRTALSLKERWRPGGILLPLLARLAQRQDVVGNSAERQVNFSVPRIARP
jgi:hypothetical protein